jgi:broad specificity phosphatase PhoE
VLGGPTSIFDHLPDPWWPPQEETEEVLLQRSEAFRRRMAGDIWSGVAVVTHWGFVRAVTGLKVPNGSVLRIDPTRPDREAEQIFVPDTGLSAASDR